ncbi:SDR family NAD(P)-dependent oxidoreductase [Bacillus sp. 7884-1]|uniref:SDR family NAD(P)-dependent oxidoreductase n=1 Tax=Bacillus sp. 7884-1 TaxID=2021693 RepID=UPI000BA65447|nr:SDR family NAD(P)-dependent oxidoreductase [Bacillus sp. 7884-1]PAE38715.1 gluconate 5-dehydrogenase [Bacillus sp. 7884-1]
MSLNQFFDLTGKTAIVPGGGSGLGRQMAIALAKAGANVVVGSRRLEVCENAVKEIETLGGQAFALALDVTDPESVGQAVEKVISQFGKIDILVNASGVAYEIPATEMPFKEWQVMIDTNLTGTFLMCQAVGRHMIENKYGKIINVSSTVATRGTDPEVVDSVGYAASKGAVNTLTKDLAVKWARHGLTVNAIAPGIMTTGMNDPQVEGTLANRLGGEGTKTPSRRLGRDSDIAGAVIYFASASSDYCNGNILGIDGGLGAK